MPPKGCSFLLLHDFGFAVVGFSWLL